MITVPPTRGRAWDGVDGDGMSVQNIEVSFELPVGEEEEALIPGGLPWQLMVLAVLVLALGGRK